MVVPLGSARVRRSRATYRPTVTPEGSTLVESSTGTTSSGSHGSGTLALRGQPGPQVSEPVPPWGDGARRRDEFATA